jgi:hypothetical protein
MDHVLKLTVDKVDGTQDELLFHVRNMINGGYSSRNQRDLQAHIDELKELNLPNPEIIPTFFPVSNHLVTVENSVQVQHNKTNGEVEFILFFTGGDWYFTVGSDHTDRALESFSVPISKQNYPNFIAPVVWQVSEVLDHWDEIELKSWVTVNEKQELYQEGSLADILPFSYWVNRAKELNVYESGTAIMSGTVPLVDGIKYGEKFEFQMTDPVLGRTIASFYELEVLIPPIT